VRRLHHLLHLLPGEPDPAGEGEVAAGRELHGSQRGPLSPGRGPGGAAEPDLNNTQPQRAATWGRAYGCCKPSGRLEGTGRSGTGPYEKNKTVSLFAVGAGVLTRPPWQFPRLFVGAHSVRPRAAEVSAPTAKPETPPECRR